MGLGLCTAGACTNTVEPSTPVQAESIEKDPSPNSPEPAAPEAIEAIEPLALRCDGPAVQRALAELDERALESLARTGTGKSTRMLVRWEVERRFTDDGTLDRDGVEAFVAALIGELGMAPPSWWVEQLASGRRRAGDEDGPLAYDSGRGDSGDRRGAWVAGPGKTRVRPAVARQLTAVDGKLFFDLSMGRVELGPLPESSAAIEIARARAGSTLYYASFDPGAGGVRFPLRAVASDGSQRWTTEVCGPDRQILGGLGHATAQIVVVEPAADPTSTGQKVPSSAVSGIAVFTAESHGVALDVFDPDTGERTLAWSSDLWFARR